MQLTKFTDLGLRVTMLLAASPTKLSTADVASVVNAPYTHVAKVVARLSALGMIESTKGRGGGISIGETGMSTSIGALVRDLEGPGEVVECDGATPCPFRRACNLRGALRQAQEAFLVTLDAWTVADLATPPTLAVLRELVLTAKPG